jgi:hypothetical protein
VNRRGFLKACAVGMAAVVAASKIPSALFDTTPTRLFDGPITWRGVPLLYDQYCQQNTIYFINPEHLWVKRVGLYGSDEWKAISEIVH